jgi:uncharacterized protein (TIGR02246 family)
VRDRCLTSPCCCRVLCSILVVACTSTRRTAASGDDVAAISLLDSTFVRANRSGDVESYLSAFSDSATVLPPNSAPILGKAAIRAWVTDFFRNYTVTATLTLHKRRVAADWAFEQLSYATRTSPRAGGDTVEDRGKEVLIFQKQSDGTWKAYMDIWNSDVPPAPH